LLLERSALLVRAYAGVGGLSPDGVKTSQWKWAAGIGLAAAEVGLVLQRRLLHPAGAAAPARGRAGQDGCEREPGRLLGPAAGEFGQIEVLDPAAAPIEPDRPLASSPQLVLDDRLGRRETGPGDHKDQRPLGSIRQRGLAKGGLHAHGGARLEPGQGGHGEAAARDLADMQLGAVIQLGRVGHRIASAVAILEQELQMLAGAEFRPDPIGKAQLQDADVGRRPVQAVQPGVEDLARVGVARADPFGRDLQVGAGGRLAELHRLGRPRD